MKDLRLRAYDFRDGYVFRLIGSEPNNTPYLRVERNGEYRCSAAGQRLRRFLKAALRRFESPKVKR